MRRLSQKIEHLQDALPAFSFLVSIVAFPSLAASSVLISSVFSTTASILVGDAFEPISSIFAAYSSGCSALYLAASSSAFLAFSAFSA